MKIIGKCAHAAHVEEYIKSLTKADANLQRREVSEKFAINVGLLLFGKWVD